MIHQIPINIPTNTISKKIYIKILKQMFFDSTIHNTTQQHPKMTYNI